MYLPNHITQGKAEKKFSKSYDIILADATCVLVCMSPIC